MAENEESPSPAEGEFPGGRDRGEETRPSRPSRGKGRGREGKMPFGPWALFQGGLFLTVRHLPLFFLVSLVCNLPLLIFLVLVRMQMVTGGMDSGSRLLLLSGVILLLILLGWTLASAALVYAAVRFLSGDRPTLGDALARGFSRFLPLLLVSLVVAFLVAMGSLFFVVPGLIVGAMLFLAPAVVVMEKAGLWEALNRSTVLTKGYKMDIFLGALIPQGLLHYLLNWVWERYGMGWLFSLMGEPDPARLESYLKNAAFLHALGSGLISVFLSALAAGLTAYAYVRLKEIKEGKSLKDLVEVFQ